MLKGEISLGGYILNAYELAKKESDHAMLKLKESRSNTYKHSVHVRDTTQVFLQYLSEEEDEEELSECFQKEVLLSALTHDIGKLYVPKQLILLDRSLTEEERDVMKKHTLWAQKALPKHALPMQRDVAVHHHDDFRSVSLATQIVAVCDTYCALTEERSYKKPMTRAEALQTMMFDPRNKNLNPYLVDRFSLMEMKRILCPSA